MRRLGLGPEDLATADDLAKLPVIEREELTAAGTVLLNYRLGDLCAWLGEACSCGRNLPLISYVQGRRAEWLVGEAGQLLHGQAIHDLMRRREDLLRYQVVQRDRERLEAVVVPAPECDHDELTAWIGERFRERLGTRVHTDVSFATDLPRTPEGKALRVVSELPLAAAAVERARR